MNALISINEQPVYQVEGEKSDKRFFGDILAVSLIGSYTLFTLAISSWSAVIFLTGSPPSKAPIGLIVNLIKSSGVL